MPTKPEMSKDLKAQMDLKKKRGIRCTHELGASHQKYYAELARAAEITPINDIYAEIFTDSVSYSKEPGFRNYKYVINGNDIHRERE